MYFLIYFKSCIIYLLYYLFTLFTIYLVSFASNFSQNYV